VNPLAAVLGPLSLENPITTASGTFGYGLEFTDFVDLSAIGGLCTKGLSLRPHAGNPPPRICETPSGMLNAIGLQNVGIEGFLKRILPRLRGLTCPIVANISGESVADYAYLARELTAAGGVTAIEINVSCPNVGRGGVEFCVEPAAVAEVVTAVRAATDLTVICKLSPNVTDVVAIARAAESSGSDAVSLINTLVGMAIDVRTRRHVIQNVTGGLSGPAVKPIALRMVYEVSQSVRIPVIGIGGIATATDAAEFLLAGATAVQVGTANFVNPMACPQIIAGLRDYCRDTGVTDVRELIGAAHPAVTGRDTGR
jgi:dihydroorotate dehydrogenase (NAD+) catalytic subunit